MNPFAMRSVEMIDTKTRLSEFGIEFTDSLFLCLKCVMQVGAYLKIALRPVCLGRIA